MLATDVTIGALKPWQLSQKVVLRETASHFFKTALLLWCRSSDSVKRSVSPKVNPLRRSCVAKRSRYGAVRMCLELGEPPKIVRVEALSLRRRANVA